MRSRPVRSRPPTRCFAPTGPRTSSDGALALAADDLVELVAVPVHEVLDVLGAELDGQREVLDEALELVGADALDELVELLAVGAVLLVVAHPALDRIRHPLRGDPRLEPLAHLQVALVVAAREVRDVGGDLAAADLHRGPVEPDVGEVVLAA